METNIFIIGMIGIAIGLSMAFELAKWSTERDRLRADNEYLKSLNGSPQAQPNAFSDDELYNLLGNVNEDELERLSASSKFAELSWAMKTFENSKIYLPVSLWREALRFEDRNEMIKFMDTRRKGYATELKKPLYKENPQTLNKMRKH